MSDSLLLANDISNRIIETNVVGGIALAGREDVVARSDTASNLRGGLPDNLSEVAEDDMIRIELAYW